MNRLALLVVITALSGFGQTTVDKTTRDASTGKWRFPESTYASLPTASTLSGFRFTVTDAASSACAAGGGTVKCDVRSDGTSWVPLSSSGSMIYPGAGVANSTGSAWGTSYTVGTGANNLVQLNGSSQLPAVSAALLTNLTVARRP